jgi:putative ABC transport system ATP-binding protein
MALLEKVGLGERWNHRPKEMSGGQMQRVAIARSLANNPSILLCDEPTGNLDLKTGVEIHQLLCDLNKKDGVTVICATHDHNMFTVCDRMVWISDGQIERMADRANVTIEKASLGTEDYE